VLLVEQISNEAENQMKESIGCLRQPGVITKIMAEFRILNLVDNINIDEGK
jgi:hypothetical protein